MLVTDDNAKFDNAEVDNSDSHRNKQKQQIKAVRTCRNSFFSTKYLFYQLVAKCLDVISAKIIVKLNLINPG